MRRRATACIVTAFAALALVGPADAMAARPTVKAQLHLTNGKQRLYVIVSKRRAFTARERPRAVAVRYGRAFYRLRNATPRRSARGRAAIWRSDARSDVARLSGRRVLVTVRTTAATAKFSRRVTPPPRIFQPPDGSTRGEPAFGRIKQYFVNSRFTNCPGGWPSSCSSEQRFNHCAGGDLTGTWQSRAFPPTTTSNVVGSYRIVDAYQSESGSWGVTYEVTLQSGATGIYTWAIAPDGRMSGAYRMGDRWGPLLGYRWQQPASC